MHEQERQEFKGGESTEEIGRFREDLGWKAKSGGISAGINWKEGTRRGNGIRKGRKI